MPDSGWVPGRADTRSSGESARHAVRGASHLPSDGRGWGFDEFDSLDTSLAPTPKALTERPFRRFAESGPVVRYRALRHPPRLGSGRVRVARLRFARHRRPILVLLMLLAVWFTVRAAGPAPPTTVRVMIAAHDLSAGRRLSSGDLEMASWPAGMAPSGRLATDPAGQVLAVSVREGEALTDARLLGPGLLRGLPAGTVAVPVRLTDPGSAALVRAGDHVDVIAGTASTWSADEAGGGSTSSPATITRPARNALVLAVSGNSGMAGGGAGGGVGLGALGGSTGVPGDADDDALAGLLVLAVQAGEADRLAGAVTGSSVSVVVLP